MSTVQPLKYIPAFDGVRGLFCILIISHHWIMPYLQGPFAFLWWLLQVFFMLSAYLITRILLYDKSRMNFKALAKRFYTRRALRIFPLYFAYLIVVGGLLLLAGTSEAGANNPEVIYFKQNWGFLFTYTYNFTELVNHFRGIEFHLPPLFSHLWSLSLEEQFYFIFPLAIFFLSDKHLKRFILAFIIGAPIVRLIAFHYLQHLDPVNTHWQGIVTVRNSFFHIDTLAYGVAVAIFDLDKIKKPVILFGILFVTWLAANLISAHFIVAAGDASNIKAALMEPTFMTYHYNYFFNFTLTNIMCAAFVVTIIKNTAMTKLFVSKPAIYLGKISYGIYIYHLFVMLLTAGLLHAVLGDLSKFRNNLFAELGIYGVYLCLLVLVAHLSYKYFESYFIKLKDKT